MSSLGLSGLNEGAAHSVRIGTRAIVAMVDAGAGGKAWGTGVTVGTGGWSVKRVWEGEWSQAG